MSEDTRPAALDSNGVDDPWSSFRVQRPGELLTLFRLLRDGGVPVVLNCPGGGALATTLWTIDEAQQRLNFSADDNHPQLAALIESDEAVAVAYLDAVKLQFDLQGLLLVRGVHASVLQCELPDTLYRFQRRQAYRVRTLERNTPTARFRHPSMPDMTLKLRIMDVSIGGCALLLPHDTPPLQPGAELRGVRIDLDADTRFEISLMLHHVTSITPNDLGVPGVRVGCEWLRLSGDAERALQRYIDQTQKRRRLLTLQ
jgi:c-di-GMP-binding flagellar brake protein YcgR